MPNDIGTLEWMECLDKHNDAHTHTYTNSLHARILIACALKVRAAAAHSLPLGRHNGFHGQTPRGMCVH